MEWVDQEVMFMPYLNIPTTKISFKAKILPSEIIIVVDTEQSSQTYGNKLMFPAQAVREIRENYPTYKHVNILIFKDEFTPMQLSIIKRDAKKWNNTVYIKKNDTMGNLIDYINNGDATVDRKKKIWKIIVFAQGYPGSIEFGLNGENEDQQSLTKETVKKLNIESFIQNPIIESYACRTGNSSKSSSFGTNWEKISKPEESLAQQISDHLNATVYAFIRRTNYNPTWLDNGDVKYKQKYMTIQDENVSNPLSPLDWYRAIKTKWDEALWNENGAYAPPRAGNTPEGLPSNKYIFKKGQKPTSIK